MAPTHHFQIGRSALGRAARRSLAEAEEGCAKVTLGESRREGQHAEVAQDEMKRVNWLYHSFPLFF